jgi:hypothetical protein
MLNPNDNESETARQSMISRFSLATMFTLPNLEWWYNASKHDLREAWLECDDVEHKIYALCLYSSKYYFSKSSEEGCIGDDLLDFINEYDLKLMVFIILKGEDGVYLKIQSYQALRSLCNKIGSLQYTFNHDGCYTTPFRSSLRLLDRVIILTKALQVTSDNINNFIQAEAALIDDDWSESTLSQIFQVEWFFEITKIDLATWQEAEHKFLCNSCNRTLDQHRLWLTHAQRFWYQHVSSILNPGTKDAGLCDDDRIARAAFFASFSTWDLEARGELCIECYHKSKTGVSLPIISSNDSVQDKKRNGNADSDDADTAMQDLPGRFPS